MNDRTETEFVHMLRQAAQAAPEPVGDLAEYVRRRRRDRSRRRWQTTFAVAGVVGLIAAGTAITNPLGGRDGEQTTVTAQPGARREPTEPTTEPTTKPRPA
ncbi:MAG TPA: hypothetical protein VIR33_05115, partial [Thermopolyspora sp.]